MGMFLADLTFTIELIAIALGFYFLYLSKKEQSKDLKIGAFLLIIGGIGAILCTSYFSLKLWAEGKLMLSYLINSHEIIS